MRYLADKQGKLGFDSIEKRYWIKTQNHRQDKQAKQHQSFLGDLKKGNKVITKGGIYGEIVGITDTVLTLEIAENVQIKIDRQSIAGPQVKEDGKEAKDGKTKKLKSSGS